jgi:hypothetical protein
MCACCGSAGERLIEWIEPSVRRGIKLFSICALLNHCDTLARAYVAKMLNGQLHSARFVVPCH